MIRPFVGMLVCGSHTDNLASGPHQLFAWITTTSQIRYPSSTVSAVYIEKSVERSTCENSRGLTFIVVLYL